MLDFAARRRLRIIGELCAAATISAEIVLFQPDARAIAELSSSMTHRDWRDLCDGFDLEQPEPELIDAAAAALRQQAAIQEANEKLRALMRAART